MDLIKRLLRLPPDRKPRPLDELAELLTIAWDLLDRIPDPRATPQEKRQAAPYMHFYVLDLVSQVICGMGRREADYVGYPVSAADLRAGDQRAARWQVLGNIFTELAKCCRTYELLEQADTARAAIQVIRMSEAGVRRAVPDEADHRRLGHMDMARRAMRRLFSRGGKKPT